MNKQPVLDEQQAIQHFNEAIDALITGQAPPITYKNMPDPDLFTIARLLAAADVAKLSRQRQRTWPQVMHQHQQARYRRRLSYGMAAAIFAAGFFLLITSTTLQAWAQALLFRFGGFTVTNNTEWTAAGLEALTAEAVGEQAVVNQPLSQKEASHIAGFPVLLPTYVPADLTLTVTDVTTETNGAYVSIAYTGWGILSIMQWKLPPGRQHNMGIGDATTKPVMIRGYQGHSIENAGLGAVGDDTTFRPSNDNALIWEEQGILFQIVSAGADGSDFQALPVAELLKIAESLQP